MELNELETGIRESSLFDFGVTRNQNEGHRREIGTTESASVIPSISGILMSDTSRSTSYQAQYHLKGLVPILRFNRLKTVPLQEGHDEAPDGRSSSTTKAIMCDIDSQSDQKQAKPLHHGPSWSGSAEYPRGFHTIFKLVEVWCSRKPRVNVQSPRPHAHTLDRRNLLARCECRPSRT